MVRSRMCPSRLFEAYSHFVLLIVRSSQLGFGPGGYPSHAYFSPPSKNKYIVKSHLRRIRFRASGVPISRNSHLTIKKCEYTYFGASFQDHPRLRCIHMLMLQSQIPFHLILQEVAPLQAQNVAMCVCMCARAIFQPIFSQTASLFHRIH